MSRPRSDCAGHCAYRAVERRPGSANASPSHPVGVRADYLTSRSVESGNRRKNRAFRRIFLEIRGARSVDSTYLADTCEAIEGSVGFDSPPDSHLDNNKEDFSEDAPPSRIEGETRKVRRERHRSKLQTLEACRPARFVAAGTPPRR